MPISMGFDLTQGWYAAMKRQADELGYEIIVRDPNWNIDAGAQALSQLIDEKPDILIFHAVDMQAYNKLIKKAVDAGINVIQMNLKSPNNGDAYVGGDWYQLVGDGGGRTDSAVQHRARQERQGRDHSRSADRPGQSNRPDGDPG